MNNVSYKFTSEMRLIFLCCCCLPSKQKVITRHEFYKAAIASNESIFNGLAVSTFFIISRIGFKHDESSKNAKHFSTLFVYPAQFNSSSFNSTSVSYSPSPSSLHQPPLTGNNLMSFANYFTILFKLFRCTVV